MTGPINFRMESGYGLLTVLPPGANLVGEPAYDSKEGGLRKIVQGTLDLEGIDSEGYTLSWTDGDGMIYPVPLQIKANGASKSFGTNDPVNFNGFSISGLVKGDIK